jgi:hypothetical protein
MVHLRVLIDDLAIDGVAQVERRPSEPRAGALC